jgi:hypothetical protein
MFPTRNKLFVHLREQLHLSKLIVHGYQMAPGTTPVIVKPERKPHMGTGYTFCGYKFAEARIQPSTSAEDQWVCIDSGCRMTMADEKWFQASFPKSHIATMPTPVRIKGIATDAHVSNLYSVVTIFVPGQQHGKSVLMELELEVHLVQGLKCHRLIGVDMLKPYGMSLDLDSSVLTIPSCDVSAQIRTKSLNQLIQRRKVKVSQRTIVLPYSRRVVPVTFKPFTIVEKVGKLAYKLQLLKGRKIHPVISAECITWSDGKDMDQSSTNECQLKKWSMRAT